VNIWTVSYVLSIGAAAALLAACGGSLVAPASVPLDAAYTTASRYVTIVPNRSTKKTFEYVISDYGTYASIFDYPKSDRQIGTIDDVGGQGCTNVLYGDGKKTFWIVAGPNDITEFKVPAKPIKTLSVSVGKPSSCAMNAAGDLAVGILSNGDVVIFARASGAGSVFTTPLTDELFDGYDDHGNLFADGFVNTNRTDFGLVELPKDSTKFQTITTSNTVGFPGSVQWDGTYLTVVDQLADAIYRYAVSGTTATLRGTVSLLGASDCAQTWIGEGVVFCADAGYEDGKVYAYPAGGKPLAALTGNFDLPVGVVSVEK